MQRALRVLMRLLEWWAILLMVAMTGLVVAGVFFRYVVDAPLSWYDEFAEYTLVWVTFYGAVIAAYRQMHMGVATVVEMLPRPVRRWTNLLAETLVFGLHLAVFYYGLRLMEALEFESSISVPWVRMPWVYSVMPITGALMMLMGAIRIAGLLRSTAAPAEG